VNLGRECFTSVKYKREREIKRDNEEEEVEEAAIFTIARADDNISL